MVYPMEFFIKNAWNFGKILVSGKSNSTVIFFTFIILNVPIYGVSNLLSVKFFVDKNVLFFGLIMKILFFRTIFFLTFCLVLIILILIVAQLFFIFIANFNVFWLVMGLISIVFNIVPYKISCANYFKYSMYDLLIAIYIVGNNSTHLCLLFLANNLKYCSNVWFIRSVWPFIWGWKTVDMFFFKFFAILYWILTWTICFCR